MTGNLLLAKLLFLKLFPLCRCSIGKASPLEFLQVKQLLKSYGEKAGNSRVSMLQVTGE